MLQDAALDFPELPETMGFSASLFDVFGGDAALLEVQPKFADALRYSVQGDKSWEWK